MDQNYTRIKYSNNCLRFLDPFYQKSCPGEFTKHSNFRSRTIKTCKGRAQDNADESANQPVAPHKDQYLSRLFLVWKRDNGKMPVINLKHLNIFIRYQHPQMKGLNLLQNMLLKGKYMCIYVSWIYNTADTVLR